jgi:pentatricopeptide repeat protein
VGVETEKERYKSLLASANSIYEPIAFENPENPENPENSESLLFQTSKYPDSEKAPVPRNPSDALRLRHNELFRLYLIFQEMKTAGVSPDEGVYNTLINACAGAGDLDKALESMEAMQVQGG